MIYQKFIPEGWNEEEISYTKEELEYAYENKQTLQGKIGSIDCDNNVYINLGNNIKGMIPQSELGIVTKNNKYIQFKVKGIESREGPYILSRTDVKNESLNWAINLNEGDIVSGIVRNIKPYGAFVEIAGGVSGLLYVNDISVARMKSPEEKLQLGQRIDVKIKSIDKKNKKFYLSYKDMLGTWEENAQEFDEGSIVTGTVKETAKNKCGVFIELRPNLIGMCEYTDKVKYGDKVNVKIKRIIPDKKKIKLVIVNS